MQDPLQRPRALRFEIFEMDLDSEEISKSGLKVKLRCQPFRMLATIAERNGDVVTYEELQTQFWPTGAIDNYKHSLGNSMLEIRKVLDDPANKPRYIQTVSRGYRFLMPVELIPRSSANGNGSGSSVTDGLPAEIQKIRLELIDTADCRRLALLLYRCKGICDQHPRHPDLSELHLLVADIQSAIDRSAVFEPNWANPPISVETASLVFDDPNAVSVPDHLSNRGWKTIGLASEFVLLTVEHSVHRKNGKQVVLIHRARRATPQERRFYEQTQK
jgi:DNA-binding winged helix-turn-helix (wHTH) protein/uncharacterized DUF497 family protein